MGLIQGSALKTVVNTVVLAAMASACAVRGIPLPSTGAEHHQFVVGARREVAFEALLHAAHHLNLNVKVLEKSSGLVGFENATLTAVQLDAYCNYPFMHPRTRQPLKTFSEWSRDALARNQGQVTGVVALNVVMTEASPASTHVDLRTNWIGATLAERYTLVSKGVLERQIESAILERLQRSDRGVDQLFEDEDDVDRLFVD